MSSNRIRVQFVCLGNICRSPLAEGVFRHLVTEQGIASEFVIASSGTGAWHVGQAPDSRMQKTAYAKGVDISRQRARQFKSGDLEDFDHILAMDQSNLQNILRHDAHGEYTDKVHLFREYDPEPGDYDVPDPYYGGDQGFETVFRIVDRTCRQFLDQIRG